MSFTFRCPKCQGCSFTIYQDKHFSSYKDQAFGLVFTCRCGKQLFGDQVVREHDRQKAEWESRHHRSEALPAPAMREPEPGTYHPVDDAPMAEEEVSDLASSGTGAETCAWAGCDNPVRSNSKYCSRACSNKNARQRHKSRKRTTSVRVAA